MTDEEKSRTQHTGEIEELRDEIEGHKATNFRPWPAELLPKIINQIKTPIFAKDEQHRFVFLNDAACGMIGHPREYLLNKSDYDFVPRDRAAFLWERDDLVLQTAETDISEETITRDGRDLTISTLKTRYIDPETGKKLIVGIVQDISERKQTQEQYRQMVELSPNPISIIDKDGSYLYLNRKFTEVFGYTLQDIPKGKDWFRKAFPDDNLRREAMSLWISDIENRRLCTVKPREFRVRCKDGSFRDVVFRPAVMERGMYFFTYEDLTELKRAQQTLRESEQRYRLIFDHSPLGIMHCDADGVIVDCNRRFVEVLGSSKEALIGFSMLERLQDEAMKAAVLDSLAGRIGYYEGDYLSVTGNKLAPIRALFSRITSEDGGILGAACIFVDTSEHKQAERQLRESEARYRAIVEDQTELISRYIPNGTLTFVNAAYCRYFDDVAEKLIGSPLWDHVFEEDQEKLGVHIASLSHEHPVSSIEHRAITRDGEIRFQQWTHRAIPNAKGEVFEIQAVGRDITGQRQAEEALRASEERLRIIFECAPDAYYLMDLEGNFVDGNRAAEEISGYERHELIGKSFLSLDLLPAKQKAEATRLLAMNAKGRPTGPDEFTLKRKDGKEVVLEIRTFPTKVGSRTLVLGIAREITERKRAEEALKESKRSLQALSSKLISAQEEERRRIAVELHDSIGASLSAIQIHAETALLNMESCNLASESIERVVATTKSAIDEIRRIITDLRPSILDDFGIIKTAYWFCREFEATYPGVRIEKRISLCEDEVPTPLKIAIFRIIQEAFHNIAKYSKADRVIIDLAKKDDDLELIIEDNGVGFDVNAALSCKRNDGGIGLGSMRERAELTGGSFHMESLTGVGVTLCARWPSNQ